jgi:putative SOS response-associated peptidase YedK
MINARAETAAEKPSFRAAYRKRRCLVLADGFYEWQKVPGERTKQPYHVRMKDGRPFAFAGLWEAWRQREGRRRGAAGGAEPGDAGSRQTGAGEAAAGDDWLLTCTILTTAPNDLMKPIHDRMPVILPRGAYDAWLAEGEAPPDEIAALLVPFDPGAMEAYPVSRAVNNPKHDAPELVEPLSGGGPAS